MTTRYYIGEITITEPLETTRHYETAAWWTTYRVEPGTYKVFGYRYCGTGKYIWQPGWDALGTVTGCYFGTPYDKDSIGNRESAPMQTPKTLSDHVADGSLKLAPWCKVGLIPAIDKDGNRCDKTPAIFLDDDAPYYSRYEKSVGSGYSPTLNPDHPAI